MFGNFTEAARKIMVSANKEMSSLKHPYVGSEHLLLAILKNKNEVSEKLKDYNLTYEYFKQEIIDILGVGKEKSGWFLYTPLLKRILENAIIDSKENNNGEVTISHLFSGLLEEGEGVAIRVMLGMGLDLDELYHIFSYKLVGNKKGKKGKKLMIDELGYDLTQKAYNNELDPVIGRDKELSRILEILSRRTKNNPVLIGEAGVGKTALVEELARRIVSSDVPLPLRNKRIISLDMGGAVAGTKYRGEFEERMRKILKEIEENEDIILFIDEIHTLVGAGGAEGAIDASNIFKPALARGKLRCIGATTIQEYKKYIEEDSALERRFQKVVVEVPSKEIVKTILCSLKPIYESYHKVILKEDLLSQIATLTEKYIYDRNEPDRSIDILDEVCAKVSLKESKEIKKYKELEKEYNRIVQKKKDAIISGNFDDAFAYKTKENELSDQMNHIDLYQGKTPKQKEVTIKDVAEVIASKTGIPIYEIEGDKIKSLQQLEKSLHQKIIGEEEAIESLCKIARKIKLGFYEENKCYSLLFAGPSGVGKTKLAKVFGANFVGNKSVIKLDMSEYKEEHSVSKILGAPPGYVGYDDHKNILEEIRNKPYSVLILDEMEKAHPAIRDLFYQILDEGKIKDSKGRTVYLNHVLIIMTSNIGFMEEHIGFTKSSTKQTAQIKEKFSLPFMNRVDDVILFKSLTKENINTIIQKYIDILKNKYKKKGVHVRICKPVIEEIIDLSNYQEYGARKVEKIIKDKIENLIIEEILRDQTQITIKSLKQNQTSV